MQGRANIALAGGSGHGMQLGNSSYEKESNIMAQELVIAGGKYPAVENLLILNFTNTQQNSTAPIGSGFRYLEILKPGYGGTLQAPAPAPIFSDNWARAMRMYDHHRYMAVTGTNNYNWRCAGDNAAGCSVIRWEDRQLPSYAFQDPNWCPGCLGMPWEYVLLAANELERDVWINVPVTASAPTVCRTKPTTEGGDPRQCLDTDPTTTYEYQLAKLFRDGNNFTNNIGLKPGCVGVDVYQFVC